MEESEKFNYYNVFQTHKHGAMQRDPDKYIKLTSEYNVLHN